MYSYIRYITIRYVFDKPILQLDQTPIVRRPLYLKDFTFIMDINSLSEEHRMLVPDVDV
jgi:hypothetical protein